MKGLVHLYYGQGKGKTTAAIGLALRAWGNGMKVLVAQFLKSGDSGEILAIKDFEWLDYYPAHTSNKFYMQMTPQEQEEAERIQLERFDEIISQATQGDYDILVLDELVDVMNFSSMPISKLTDFLASRPEKLEVVITGHNPKKELIDLADYVTEMNKIKHPYDKGISARKGIEK